MRKLSKLTALLTLFLASPSFAQNAGVEINLVTSLPASAAEEAYRMALAAELREAGFTVSGDEARFQVGSDELFGLLAAEDGTLALTFLQNFVGEGDVAGAFLSSPGAFETLEEHRLAAAGAIGDTARDEINNDTAVALRLWTHSTGSLLSAQPLGDLEAFAGLRMVTRDPYSVALFEELGAQPMALAFGEIAPSLLAGSTDAAVVPQDTLTNDLLDQFSGGSVLGAYKPLLGVTLASPRWWTSLTAEQQARMFSAMNVAEEAAFATARQEFALVQERLDEFSLTAVSWEQFNPLALQSVVASTTFTRASVNPGPVIEYWNNFKARSSGRDEGDAGDTAPVGDTEKARIFFATTRRYDQQEGTLLQQFANSRDPEGQVRCGEILPAFPKPALNLGVSNCVAMIEAAVADAGGQALIHVHGFRNTFADAVKTAVGMAQVARLNGVVIVWSWPSAGELASYSMDEETVVISEPSFNQFVSALAGEEEVEKLDFIAHSMGSRLIANLMRDEWIERPAAVVLAAADVARPFLEQAVSSAQSAEVTVLATDGDRALQSSQILHRRPRAGQATPLFLMPGVDTINLSAFDKWWTLNHRHAFNEVEVLEDLHKLFRGTWSAAARGLESYPSDGSPVAHFVIEPDDNS